jgi:hypothetical protein
LAVRECKTVLILLALLATAAPAAKVGLIVFSDQPMTEEKPLEEYDTRDSFIFGADISIHARVYLPYHYAKHLALIQVETGAEKVLSTGHRLEIFPPDAEEPLYTWTKTGKPIKDSKDQAKMLSILPNEFGLDSEGRLRTIENCGREWGDPPEVVRGAYRVTYTYLVELAGPFEFESGGYAWTDVFTVAQGSFEFVVP